MEPENIGNYLVNGLGSGGFRLQPFSPITTLNHSLNSLKGGSDNAGTGGSGSVAEHLLGRDTFAIPSYAYAYSGGKITNEPIYNNGEVSVIDDDLHKKLLELAKDDTNANENTNTNTNVKHGTKKRKKELHLLTRKKHTKKVDKNNKTRRQSK
jgi:hypothetical protein